MDAFRPVVLLPCFFFLLLASCMTMPFNLITEGTALTTPVDTELLEKAILLSLNRFNWDIQERSSNSIKALYRQPGSGGSVRAEIEVLFDQNGYSIKYLDSKFLEVNLRTMKIHQTYNKWIANLNKSIYSFYISEM